MSYCFVFNWLLNDVKGGHSLDLFSWFILIHLDSYWFSLIHLDSSWFILIHLDSSWFILILFEQLPIRYICRSSGQALFNRIINQLQPLVETFLEADSTYQMVPWRLEIGGEGWRCTDVTYVDLKPLGLRIVSWCLMQFLHHEKVWSVLTSQPRTFRNQRSRMFSSHHVSPRLRLRELR